MSGPSEFPSRHVRRLSSLLELACPWSSKELLRNRTAVWLYSEDVDVSPTFMALVEGLVQAFCLGLLVV